jgi:hypothetical protein
MELDYILEMSHSNVVLYLLQACFQSGTQQLLKNCLCDQPKLQSYTRCLNTVSCCRIKSLVRKRAVSE